MSGQQLVGCPPLAALLLDTTEVLHKRDRAFCDFSTLAKDDEGIGYLRFRHETAAQGGHRQVEIDLVRIRWGNLGIRSLPIG
jgi:hypothetical protein